MAEHDHNCLHCTIIEAIVDHFDRLGHQHGETVVIDAQEIKTAVVRLLAEVLAVIDDDNDRSRVLAHVLRKVIDEVNDIREQGRQAAVFRPS